MSFTGTPLQLQLMHRLKNTPTTTKRNSKSLCDSIKRHIFHKNLIMKTPKHQPVTTPSSAMPTFNVSSKLLYRTLHGRITKYGKRRMYSVTPNTYKIYNNQSASCLTRALSAQCLLPYFSISTPYFVCDCPPNNKCMFSFLCGDNIIDAQSQSTFVDKSNQNTAAFPESNHRRLNESAFNHNFHNH